MIEVIFSETWLHDDIDNVNNILTETIKDFVDKEDNIINIETKTGHTGLTRFWIYVKRKN